MFKKIVKGALYVGGAALISRITYRYGVGIGTAAGVLIAENKDSLNEDGKYTYNLAAKYIQLSDAKKNFKHLFKQETKLD